jgi:Na+-transporting NADH:ubiquinone oxidoreductase subunit NqrC
MPTARDTVQKVTKNGVVIETLLSILTAMLIAVFPALFLYFNNASEADFSEALPLLLAFSAVGLVILGVAWLITRVWIKAALISVVFSVILLNFVLLEKLLTWFIRSLKYWHVVPILLVLALHIAWFIHRKLSQQTTKNAVNILCLVVCGLVLFNGVTAAPKIVKKLQVQHRQQEQQDQQSSTLGVAEQNMPNVYLIIFDEYAGFRQMEQYYNYDNAELKNFLMKHNFNISYNSRNESILSATVLTNLANLDYIVKNNTDNNVKTELRHQGKLFSIIREKGYRVQAADHGNFFGQEPIVKNENSSAKNIKGENIIDIGLLQTIIYPFYIIDTSTEMQTIHEIVNTVSNKDFIPDSPTFTVVYLSFPHAPFLVNEYGDPIKYTQRFDWENDNIYLGQFKYSTKLMMKMLDNILVNDPNSIILLQSDHGARATQDVGLYVSKFPLEIMSNTLNAVYYQGEKFDEIIDQSSVNTIRLVLDRLFDLDYGTVKVPEDTYKYE